jgi:hypothetical protein
MQGPRQVIKPHVMEADLHDEAVGDCAPLLLQLLHDGVSVIHTLRIPSPSRCVCDSMAFGPSGDVLHEALNRGGCGLCVGGPSSRTVKLQYNEGLFPLFSASPSPPSRSHRLTPLLG